MKLYQLIAVMLIFELSGCQNKQNEVVITGQIMGEIPDEVFLALPVNGVFYLGFKEPVEVDSSGHFRVKTVIDQPAFAELLNYILINEEGQIFKKNAKRPSQLKELEKELL